MPQSLSRVHVHLVFSTKNRRALLADPVRELFHQYAAETLKGLDCPALLINSVEDHVHVLFELCRTHSISHVVERLKKSTSRWIKGQKGVPREFSWQAGYGIFSVSTSNIPVVLAYIAGQKEHHRRLSFQDELRLLFKKHGVEFDERYLWD